MDMLSDVALLSRIQFALTVAYHFIFVPLSIGLGLILAIFATKYHRSRSEADGNAMRFWVRIFTATFAIGVATGITMEFSFGTNWADYSRFVGDIFGAPLAAEALFAFFLESVFLGVLLFGRNKVSSLFYTVSAWLVWAGSCLSALWILIANSWMQTPAGAELAADGSKAVITDFLAAAFNPSTLPRYTHVVVALLILGAFASLAVGAWYLLRGKHADFAMKTIRVGAVVGIVASCALIVTAHSSAVEVSQEQPTKLAMMEGMYNDEVPPLYAFGWVDEESQQVVTPFSIRHQLPGNGHVGCPVPRPELVGANREVRRHGRCRLAREPGVPVLPPYGCHVRSDHDHGNPGRGVQPARRSHPLHALAAEAAAGKPAVPVHRHPGRLDHRRSRPSTLGRLPFHVRPRRREPADEQRHLAVGFRP